MSRPALPMPVTRAATSEELASLDLEDRRAEAWLLKVQGVPVTDIAARFNVSRKTIYDWVRDEKRERIARRILIDEDIEDAVRQCEAVMAFAWRRAQEVPITSMAGPSYTKTILEAVDRVILLRGLDKATIVPGGKTGNTKVTVNIGIAAPPDRDMIDGSVISYSVEEIGA